MQIELTIKGKEFLIEFDYYDVKIENDGIGEYEFWGQKCIDKGQSYVDDFKVSSIEIEGRKPSERLFNLIETMIKDDEEIYERIENDVLS